MQSAFARAAATVAALGVAALPASAQSATLLRLRNPASVDRLVMDSAGLLQLRGTVTAGPSPNPGAAGAMLMWNPGKAALRAGYVTGTDWDDVNVARYSTALGYSNVASANNAFAAGQNNVASGTSSVALGSANTASGSYSFAAGLGAVASGPRSVALGIDVISSGDHSMALGYHASTAGFAGAFVYADYSVVTDFNASAQNQFSVRAAGGVRVFTNSGLTAGATLSPGGSTWNAVSDRRRKDSFLAVRGEDILDRVRGLSITTWRYRAEADPSVRHIGPMAQDWRLAFGFSSDSMTINSGDLDGVNLAAAQALERRTAQQAERIAALEGERARFASLEASNAALRAEVAALRASLHRIEATLAAQ